MTSPSPRHLWPVALLLSVGGCEQGVDVRVDQDAAGVAFTLKPTKGDFRPCLGTLALYADGEAKPLWYISNGGATETCVTRLRYGDSPPGFGASPPAPPLEAGKAYQVEVSGSAFTGGTRFVRR